MWPQARSRKWKAAFAFGAVVAAVVIAVVLTRITTSDTSSSKGLNDTGPVSTNLVRGSDLGTVDTDQALRAKVEPPLIASSAPTPSVRPRATDPSRRETPVASPIAAPVCVAQARKLQPAGAVLTYVATARWQGTWADVLGFSPPGAPATTAPGRRTPTRVYVLARSDCHLLVFQSYAP